MYICSLKFIKNLLYEMRKQNLTKKISLEISDFQISTSFNINSQNIQSISDLKHAISDFFQISQNEFQIENPLNY